MTKARAKKAAETGRPSPPACSPGKRTGMGSAMHKPGDRIDLHLHTTHSDGSFTTAQVLALAKKAGVSALAITDHDILDGIPEAITIGASLGIEVIPGIEISSRLDDAELHILGYFLDWKDQALNR